MSLIAMPGNDALATAIAEQGGWRLARLESRHFPDGESYLRLHADIAGTHAGLVCTLARPDERFLSLLFAARLLKENGARSVQLVAPYLAYMRQDKRFHDGEALTSAHFAELLSAQVDGLVTVDPHLHRYRSLTEIYSIDAQALTASPLLADWIGANVPAPLIVGPDSESEQWARAIADRIGAPHVVFSKSRLGDRDVHITDTDLGPWRARTPVLVDDVISSGETLAVAARRIVDQGFAPPICMAVHAIFAEGAQTALDAVGCRVVTTDAIPHQSNAISLAPLLAAALQDRFDKLDT